jgi:hypothetical protein
VHSVFDTMEAHPGTTRPSNEKIFDRWMKRSKDECHAAIAAGVPQAEVKDGTARDDLANILANARIKIPPELVMTAVIPEREGCTAR